LAGSPSEAGEEQRVRAPDEAQQGWRSLFAGDNARRAIVLAGAVALHGFFSFITNTTLPSIVAELGGVAFYAWVATVFGMGSIIGAMLAPAVLARLAPRRAYELGLALFAAGCALSATAPALGVVIVGRAVQGFSGGLLAAIATSMIPVVFADTLRSRAVALVSSVWGPVALLGPFVGGVFAQLGLWRGAFWLAMPLLGALGLLADRVLPVAAPQRTGAAAIFSAGQALRLALIAGSVLILSVASVPGALPAALAGIGLTALCLGLALRLDRRARLRVLLQGAFGFAKVVGACSTAMMLLVLGVGAGGFIPYVLSFALGAAPIVAGYIAALSSLAVAWTMFGASVGASWPHLATRLIGNVPASERVFAGGFLTTIQILAGTFGAALAGLVANLGGLGKSTAAADIAQGGLLLFLGFAVVPLLAVPFALRLLSLTRREE
jgi:MFS family permease